MAPLAVDPCALDGAGTAVVTAGEGLGSVISTLTAALSGCAGMAGDDPAGAAVGRGYDRSASKLIEAMVTTRNGVVGLGDGVRMSAHNYSVAEALSNATGGADALPAPRLTNGWSVGSPASAVGGGAGVPPGWGWVAPYIGMIWPTGDSAKLRVAATAWGAAGTQFAVAEILGTAGPMGTVRAQQIPEGGAIDAAFSDAYRSITSIVAQCQAIAAQLTGYAAQIDAVHAAIMDLLARICDPLTGIKEVWDFLTDEDEDEIKHIADDIATIIDDFTAEAEALGRQIATVLSQAETVLTTMGRQAARDWDQFLHGNPVGLAIDFAGQRFQGIGEGIWGLGETVLRYNQIRLLVDPAGYGHDGAGMVLGMAPLVGLGGEQAPSVAQSWKELLKGVTHWDEWTTNPGEALGKSEFDLATMFLPGGPVSKLAAKGRGLLGDLKKPPLLDPPVAPPAVKPPPPEPKPAPREQPLEPAPQPKPAPAPAGTAPPHSPTESKPPIIGKPEAAQPPKPTAASPGSAAPHPLSPAATPGEHLPSTPPHGSEPGRAPAPAQPPGTPAEPVPAAAHTPPPAPALSAPHAPTPHSSPEGRHPVDAAPHGPPPGNPPPEQPARSGIQGGHNPELPPESPDSTVSESETTRGERRTISGHGDYDPADGHLNVPQGTTVTAFATHGSSITDDLGNLIETGGDTSAVYSRTFLPGEAIPNYTIHPPDGLTIMGTPETVTRPTLLSDLIREDMGPVDLAVCTYDESCPTGLLYDVDGIYDESTGTLTVYGGHDFGAR